MIEINRDPGDRLLRQFGALVLPLVLGGAAALWLRRGGPAAGAAALGGAAALFAAVGLLAPRWLRPLFVGLQYATYPIGWVISHAVLLAIFALCLVPLGLLARLLGRERLGRRFDRSAQSYWVERRGRADAARYFRQF